MNLFQPIPSADSPSDRRTPLADRMRPRSLDEFVGQEHLIGPGKPLRAQIERDDVGSLIFWGPPGTGKTTLAKIIASMTRADFIEFSRNQQDGYTGVALSYQAAVNKFDCANVHAARWLRRHQHFRLRGQFARNNDLLLIATRE